MGLSWLCLPAAVLSSLSLTIDAGEGAGAQGVDGGQPDALPAVADAGTLALDGGAAPPTTAVQGARTMGAAPRPASGRVSLAAGPCVAQETARYRVTFGILGQVATAELSLAPEVVSTRGRAALLLHMQGVGSGDVLGFGKTDKRIEADFDPAALAARRWSNVRTNDGKITSDTAEQTQPGAVTSLRKRTGEPDLAESFTRAAPVLDPLGFLVRLRLALPEAPVVYEVLDGRALWLAKLSAARVDAAAPHLLRLDGKLEPIYWNGDPDKRRSVFPFSLYFTRDRFRTPVRLTVPYALGAVRAELVGIERRHGLGGRAPEGELSCVRPRRRWFWLDFMQRWSPTLARTAEGRKGIFGR